MWVNSKWIKASIEILSDFLGHNLQVVYLDPRFWKITFFNSWFTLFIVVSYNRWSRKCLHVCLNWTWCTPDGTRHGILNCIKSARTRLFFHYYLLVPGKCNSSSSPPSSQSQIKQGSSLKLWFWVIFLLHHFCQKSQNSD